MLAFLLGLIPSALNAITSITSAIANEKIAGINATTEQERIASAERVVQLQSQRDALVAESSKSKWPIWMQTFIAIGPATYLTKIFLYDKVLKLGITDPLDPNLWNVVMVVVGFYFLSTMFRR